MDDLRGLIDGAGFSTLGTIGASGNVAFRGPDRDPAEIEHEIETRLARDLRVPTAAFVRTSAQWNRIVERNPFPSEAERDPAHLTCWALKRSPSAPSWERLRSSVRGRERVAGRGREAYIVYPDGIGRSRLTSAVVEGALGTAGTARNWNTVVRLGELARSGSGRKSA